MALAGCTTSEIELIDSLITTTNQLKSYEGTSTLEISFSGESSNEEGSGSFKGIGCVFRWNKIGCKSKKAWSDEEGQKAKAAVDYELEIADTKANFSFWADVDASGDKPSMKIIFTVPELLLASLANGEYAGKYIVINYDNLFEEVDAFVDYSNVENIGKEILI